MNKIILIAALAFSSGCAAKHEAALADAESRVANCDEQLVAANARIGKLEGELKTSLAAQQVADKRLAAYKELAKKLRDAYGTNLKIEVRNGRLVVKLPNEILFDTGSSVLKDDGKASLKKLVKVLKAEERSFQIAGHTDNQPVSSKSKTFKTNYELSAQRALSAVYFLEKEGVPAKRLSAAGYGEHQPVVDNKTPENMQRNRRTEIVIMPRLDEIPTFPKDL